MKPCEEQPTLAIDTRINAKTSTSGPSHSRQDMPTSTNPHSVPAVSELYEGASGSIGLSGSEQAIFRDCTIMTTLGMPEEADLVEDVPEGTSNGSPTLDNLISRARVLTFELEAFRTRLRVLRQGGNVELGHFRGTMQSELQMLERLSEKPDSQATKHIARSSNLPFLETVWATVKRSSDVVALQKRMYTSCNTKLLAHGLRHVGMNESVNGEAKPKSGTPGKRRDHREIAVVVDTITDGGREWTKVSLLTNQRLLFDLAKQGWDSGGSEDEFDEDGNLKGDASDDEGDYDVPLLKTAKDLVRAARHFRVRTKIPTVHLVLPRIREGAVPEVDAVLDACRAAGAVLHCGDASATSAPIPTIEQALPSMAQDPLAHLSEVLNIDCTILLALVSEFSHAKVSKEPWFHAALRRQVEIEGNENLLPSLLYPAMGIRKLVCTAEAAKRMREIVGTIGTPSEKARTAIILGDDTTMSQTALVAQLQEWSAYEVPAVWQLPIIIVDQNEGNCQAKLPPQAALACKGMTSINESVFLHGWATGRTTITSNRTVVRSIENALELCGEELDECVWPKIWLCPTARSLVGKEKRGVKKQEDRREASAVKAYALPDPLRREYQRKNGLDILTTREGHDVEDLRPGGYPCEDVLAAKGAASNGGPSSVDIP